MALHELRALGVWERVRDIGNTILNDWSAAAWTSCGAPATSWR